MENHYYMDPGLRLEEVKTVGLIELENSENHFHYRTKIIETTGKNEAYLI